MTTPPAVRPPTVARLVADALAAARHAPFLARAEGTWRATAPVTVEGRIREVGNGLLAHGIGRGDRVALALPTGVDWAIADLAVLSVGAVLVPVDPAVTPDRLEALVRRAACVAAIVDAPAHAERLVAARERLPSLRHVVVGDGRRHGPDAVALELLAARGVAWAASNTGAFDDARAAVRLDDPAAILHTAGATGAPRPAVLLQRNLAAMALALLEVPGLVRPGDRVLLAPGQGQALARSLVLAGIAADLTLAFGEDADTLERDLRQVRPQILPTVPSVLERLWSAALGAEARSRRSARWSLGVGSRVSAARQAGRAPGAVLAVQARLADRMLFRHVKARFGGELAVVLCCGGPVRRETLEDLHRADVLVLEGWGVTEASTTSALNRPHRYRFGSAGPPLPHVEVRVADDGELLVRGPTVFAGYLDDPGATAAALAGGWLHTGDVGRVDDDGFVWVADRKRDLIETTAGRTVAPQVVESLITAHPAVAHAVVVGEGRPYLAALVAMDAAVADDLKADDDETARELAQQAVDAANAVLGPYEQVRRFALLPRPLERDAGELTPADGVRRHAVIERYAGLVDGLYRAS